VSFACAAKDPTLRLGNVGAPGIKLGVDPEGGAVIGKVDALTAVPTMFERGTAVGFVERRETEGTGVEAAGGVLLVLLLEGALASKARARAAQLNRKDRIFMVVEEKDSGDKTLM